MSGYRKSVTVHEPKPRVLDLLGSMPSLPGRWDVLPVQQDITAPLAPGHRYPLTFYRQVTVAEINAYLGW